VSRREPPKARRITRALLRSWPLPVPGGDGDKSERGRLLMVAGSAEIPGAAILAADAALRAGAGKVCIATDRAVAAGIAVAVPEARVVAAAGKALADEADRFDALLLGPGIANTGARLRAFMQALAGRISPVVADAGALDLFAQHRRARRASETRLILTPHLGEMAHLLQRDKAFVESRAADIASEFAAAHGAVVALKGPTTFVADPDGGLWVHDKGNIGLAISGSGDVLAGIVAALVARGASCAQATVWGVALHAQAGRRLVAEHGALGGLARELPAYIPDAMRERGPA
jgi:hydroxyethylthiazole kinase-like uncharacterized protein yjeF